MKGWVRRSDDLTRLEDRFAAHDGKMLVRSSREDRTVAPYAFAFDANMESKTKSETENKQQVDAASRDLKRLAEWQRRALPPDPVVARSLYQDWLRSLTDRARFRQAAIVANDAVAHAQYTRIAFHLEARARMGDLIEFMYEFYSAGFLHQIRSLNIKPVRGSHDLTVSLGIEALSLPTAECKDHLPKDAGSVLKFSKLSDYREPLVARDFFAYDGPVATPPRPGKAADPADFVVVTGFTEVDGKSQVWIQDRTKGSVSGFSAGESFDVGNVKGKVQSIRPKGEVVVEVDGHRRLLQAGDNLRGGVEIQDAQPNQPKESGNSTRPANP